MSALKQPSAASNSGCFDWTSSAHISLGSGMPKHPKIVPITGGKLKPQESPQEVTVPIRNGSFVQISFSDLLLRHFQQQQAHETAQPETCGRNEAKSFTCPSAATIAAPRQFARD